MVSIKALRKSKSMTQKELAQALGISVLGCTTDYLLGRTRFPYPRLTTLEDKFLGAFHAADQSEQEAVWKILEKYMDL